jgi:peroxiredoxin
MFNLNRLRAKFSSAIKILLALCCCLGLSFSVNAKQAEVPTSADDVKPILIGQEVPAITLTTPEGRSVSLNTLLKEKPTLLVFYRGGWCPYCNLHLAELRKIEQPLKDMGFQIIAVSPDKPEELTKTGEKHALGYTLLSDSKAEGIKKMGLAFEVDLATRSKYKAYDIDLERSSGEDHHLLPVPAALLVDTNQIVTFSFISPNYKVRVDNDVIMAAAKAQLKTKK